MAEFNTTLDLAARGGARVVFNLRFIIQHFKQPFGSRRCAGNRRKPTSNLTDRPGHHVHVREKGGVRSHRNHAVNDKLTAIPEYEERRKNRDKRHD